MPVPNFTPPILKTTFNEDKYFDHLHENAAMITDVMQIGHDEAGQLDKKLDPELSSMIKKIIDHLNDPQKESDAELELAKLTEPEVVIAVLRQSFRIQTNRANDLLIQKITDICKTDVTGIAKEVIREATGSELKRLSQLADEIFLHLGDASELLQIAKDQDRTFSIRIRTCARLLEREQDVDAIPIALGLFEKANEHPSLSESLKHLGKDFGMLKEINPELMKNQVVKPLLETLQKFERDQNIRQYILSAIGEVHEPVLAYIREKTPDQIRSDDRLWLTLALRKCAQRNPVATQQMIDWMKNEDVDDRIRLELAHKIKSPGIKYSKESQADLIDLLEYLPERYADEMRDSLQDAINNTKANKKTKKPDELFKEIKEQLCEEGNIDDIDDDLLWDLRNHPGGLGFLQSEIPHMDEDELKVMYEIIAHERYKGNWSKRINILVEAFPKLRDLIPPDELIKIIYGMARNEPRSSGAWKKANTFFTRLIDEASELSETARYYWKKLDSDAREI